jgi:hypothetical protein
VAKQGARPPHGRHLAHRGAPCLCACLTCAATTLNVVFPCPSQSRLLFDCLSASIGRAGVEHRVLPPINARDRMLIGWSWRWDGPGATPSRSMCTFMRPHGLTAPRRAFSKNTHALESCLWTDGPARQPHRSAVYARGLAGDNVTTFVQCCIALAATPPSSRGD